MPVSDRYPRRPPRSSGRGAPAATGAGLVLAAIVAAVLAAGCLPSGTRGSGAAGDGTGDPGMAGTSAASAPGSPTPRPPIVPPTPTPAPTFMVYAVSSGDSLNTIARRYGTTARSIAFWNRATYPSLDPDSPTYRPGLVKIGWTLFLIPNDVVNEDEIPGPEPSDDGTGEDPADESATPE